MLDRKLHKFYLSFKLKGEIHTVWIEGINLRHAKEKLVFKFPEATDVMDWTNEKPEDLEKYIQRYEDRKKAKEESRSADSNQTPPSR